MLSRLESNQRGTCLTGTHNCQQLSHEIIYYVRRQGFEPCMVLIKSQVLYQTRMRRLAVTVGFEPTEVLPSLVFKTRAIVHSATSPLLLGGRCLRPLR